MTNIDNIKNGMEADETGAIKRSSEAEELLRQSIRMSSTDGLTSEYSTSDINTLTNTASTGNTLASSQVKTLLHKITQTKSKSEGKSLSPSGSVSSLDRSNGGVSSLSAQDTSTNAQVKRTLTKRIYSDAHAAKSERLNQASFNARAVSQRATDTSNLSDPLVSSSKLDAMKSRIKQVGITPTQIALGATDEADELRGTSNIYNMPKSGMRMKQLAQRAMKKRFAQNALQSKHQARWATSGVNAASTSASKVGSASIAGASTSTASTSGGLAAGASVPVVLVIFSIIALLLILIILGSAGGGQNNPDIASFNEVESQVYAFFREKGLEDIQIAGIMGNMAAESGMNPALIESNGEGIGICQWSFGRKASLVAYAASVGTSWTDLKTQLDFFWDHDEWATNWHSAYILPALNYRDPSPLPGTFVSGSKSGFLAATTVEDATEQFCYGWERAGFPRINNRIKAALEYYAAMQQSGNSQSLDNANETQKAFAASVYTAPDQGHNWCAKFVRIAFTNYFGYSFPGGYDACDMYRDWCTSSNKGDLRVGMIVAVEHTRRADGSLIPYGEYGHVGIYVGDGKVISQLSTRTVQDLDEFISIFGRGGETVRWGWAYGRDLSQM